MKKLLANQLGFMVSARLFPLNLGDRRTRCGYLLSLHFFTKLRLHLFWVFPIIYLVGRQ
ncbi:hypothetical protein DT57C_000007 [Escherichia phage DT57C]|uniref:Uncharacterized protein n=2 Tax=Tequintavirus TaxID=187218 RepID=A0A0A7RSR2_9CAUD|nr:hypothetical protein ACQ32_gp007 [Escherichia phage DT57C]YP_009784859.1 hypothetical protein HOR00_gp007 [Escherichia phage DT571/2]AJA41527.1 hypothetical protein DT57C_000007 [Escherichia phage DT57C]AJA41660.1 hypothetical protein DT5712_000007 [Escherichia phage DT571/2]